MYLRPIQNDLILRLNAVLIHKASFDSRGGLYIVRARDTALFTTESAARTHKGMPRYKKRGFYMLQYFYFPLKSYLRD